MNIFNDTPTRLSTILRHQFSDLIRKRFAVVITSFILGGVSVAQGQQRMVRISEIEVDAKYLEQYKAILKYEA